MATGDDVLFEIVSGSVLLSPIATVPKSKMPLPTPTLPPPFEPPARPWHPVSSNSPPAITREVAKGQCNRLPFNATSFAVYAYYGGGFRVTEALKSPAPARPLSLLAAA